MQTLDTKRICIQAVDMDRFNKTFPANNYVIYTVRAIFDW